MTPAQGQFAVLMMFFTFFLSIFLTFFELFDRFFTIFLPVYQGFIFFFKMTAERSDLVKKKKFFTFFFDLLGLFFGSFRPFFHDFFAPLLSFDFFLRNDGRTDFVRAILNFERIFIAWFLTILRLFVANLMTSLTGDDDRRVRCASVEAFGV